MAPSECMPPIPFTRRRDILSFERLPDPSVRNSSAQELLDLLPETGEIPDMLLQDGKGEGVVDRPVAVDDSPFHRLKVREHLPAEHTVLYQVVDDILVRAGHAEVFSIAQISKTFSIAVWRCRP
jgi:hypothetical protein